MGEEKAVGTRHWALEKNLESSGARLRLLLGRAGLLSAWRICLMMLGRVLSVGWRFGLYIRVWGSRRAG